MDLKEAAKKIIPSPLLRFRLIIKEKIELNRLKKRSCEQGLLAGIDNVKLNDIFHAAEYDVEWQTIGKEISQFNITDKASGVNYGDRRAIYYLIRHLKPESVLEVGTHIGASTSHIAAALRQAKQQNGKEVSLTTVDIVNVNDSQNGPWRTSGSAYAPIDMVKKLDCDNFVQFIENNSIDFLTNCQEKYDLIFLDGDHSAKTVYQEVPAALKLLNSGGYILLHDYFPQHKPLWSDGVLIPGPHMAVSRLQSEGANIKVLPFGALPWSTKLDSNVTSLALLGKTE